MKRYAILLSHVDGKLSSNKDALDVREFLFSPKGGAWEDSEVFYRENIGLAELCVILDDVRRREFDYIFFYFSGHGGYVRDTEIELNPLEERISERYLSSLASRQLNVYDCCRSRISESFALDGSLELLKEGSNVSRLRARELFDSCVMAAMPQQMSLYACSEGECAYDLGNGGIFTQNLLSVAATSNSAVLVASQAYVEASDMTIATATRRGVKQHPDYMMAKLPIRLQLPLAINPDAILI